MFQSFWRSYKNRMDDFCKLCFNIARKNLYNKKNADINLLEIGLSVCNSHWLSLDIFLEHTIYVFF